MHTLFAQGFVVPLRVFALSLKNRETAKHYIADAEKMLGRPLSEEEREYLEDVVRQGDRVEELLRRWRGGVRSTSIFNV